jgi:hypothetical protein
MNDNPNFLLFKDPPIISFVHNYAVNKATDICKLPLYYDGNRNLIIGVGSLYKCPHCGKNYVLREDIDVFDTYRYWKSISERKARRLLKKAQK